MQQSDQQAAFSKVYLALLKQGTASVGSGPNGMGGEVQMCKYRGNSGNKCAVGHLLPDELYDPELEGQVTCSELMKPVLEKIFPGLDDQFRRLITLLQHAHDYQLKNDGIDRWKWRMEDIATEFKLEIPNAAV